MIMIHRVQQFALRLPAAVAIGLLLWLGLIALFPVFVSTGATPGALAGPTVRVSRHTSGAEGNGDSTAVAIAASGRYVAFASEASNLVNGDSNAVSDIFVRDLDTGVTSRVSVTSAGVQANSASYAPDISDDGRYVVFHSFATNLVSFDSNNVPDIFLHDRQTGATTLVSHTPGGAAGGDVSKNPVISGDGNYVAYWSFAANLVASDSNGRPDIFRWHRSADTTALVSVDSNGVQGNGNSQLPAISADGNVVAFESAASNLVAGDAQGYNDIFIRDMAAGTTQRVSVGPGGVEAQGDSVTPSISADGRLIAFVSLAANLVNGDGNGYADIFTFNRNDSITRRVSVGPGGVEANERSSAPTVGGNGRFVSFTSRATNLINGDANGHDDIFVHDRDTATTAVASIDSAGTPANGASAASAMAANGHFVAFTSAASNLVSGDGNARWDAFRHDLREPPPPTPTSTPTATPTATPTPLPALESNFHTGAPGSSFHLTGANFSPLAIATITANADPIGSLVVANSGALQFRICTDGGTQSGIYYIDALTSSASAGRAIWIDPAAPVRSPTGGGPTFCLLPDTALDNISYAPALFR